MTAPNSGSSSMPQPEARRHRVNTEGKAAQVRAYRRAMARLREEHPERFRELYNEEFAAAWDEIHVAREATAGEPPLVPRTGHLTEPPRGPGGRPSKPPLPAAVPLKPGPRSVRDVGPRIRADVGGCQQCVGYHDRGHRCSACGRPPAVTPPLRDPYAFAEFNAGVLRARNGRV